MNQSSNSEGAQSKDRMLLEQEISKLAQGRPRCTGLEDISR
ncbi:MAG: hypothetical protein V3W04_02445 [Gammaproteobacteria bacterium]